MEKPTILLEFEREKAERVRKFWVQQLPDDQKEMSIELFGQYFIRDEPMCKSLKIYEDEKAMKYCKEFWWTVVKQNKSLACFTKLDDGTIKMVAVNYCYLHSSTNDEKTYDVGRSFIHITIKQWRPDAPDAVKTILETFAYIQEMRDISKDLGIKDYLGALGLLVIPEFRGYNIGLHVLKARKVLCETLGLKASVTVFTSSAAQILAEKAGFKDIVSLTYDDLEKRRPASKFPNIQQYSKRIRYMYILY